MGNIFSFHQRLLVLPILFLFLPAGKLLSGTPLFPPSDSLTIRKTAIDTNRLLSDQPLKSPWGAVARSAVLPGWGQIYNEQYWKAGLAFSLNAFLGYHIFWYQHRWKTTGDKVYQGKRNLYTWYFSLAYLLTMVDAYVDAYLYKFDEAMDITHHIDFQEGRWRAEISVSWHF